MSMDGDVVRMNSRFLSYVPVRKKSYRTLLSLDAQISLPNGTPICFAKYAARMFPKFPVGTTTLTFSFFSISPFARSFA